MADLEALLRSAQAALTTASETLPSAEERRAEAAAAESLAASGAGAVVKTAILQCCSIEHAGGAGRLRHLGGEWLRWLRDHSLHAITIIWNSLHLDLHLGHTSHTQANFKLKRSHAGSRCHAVPNRGAACV